MVKISAGKITFYHGEKEQLHIFTIGLHQLSFDTNNNRVLE